MRKRKNQNSIIRQYKYSVSTDLHPLPPEVWNVARRMQQAWNALIAAYAGSDLLALNLKYTVAWEAFRASKDEAAYKTEKSALDKTKRETWLGWDKEAKAAIAPFDLDYSQGPNVIERFNGCIKAGRTCFPETELTHVQIPFVFPGSAAIPVSRLMNPKSSRWRIVIEGHHPENYVTNTQADRRERKMLYLELGLTRDVQIQLRCDFHRELPADGIVKRVLLCGKKIPFRGWRWHVLFQVEMPVSQTDSRTKKTVSLRICWSRYQDSVVVCQWKDTAGREGILAWPLSPTNHQDRRTSQRRPEWSEWITDYASLDDYKESEFTLDKGSDERMKMRERRRRVLERWTARRRWLYRNFTAWLVREYQTIQLDELDVKSIAEDGAKKGALAGADRWRQIVSPGDLIAIIKEMAQKHGRTIEKFPQTSTNFQSLRIGGAGLRNTTSQLTVQVFDVSWNSKAVAERVHAR